MSLLDFAEKVQEKYEKLESQGRLRHQKQIAVGSTWIVKMMRERGHDFNFSDIHKFNETITTHG